MGRADWFRRATWSAEDAAAFQAKLDRSRGGSEKKAQYLRIQAVHLAEAGDHESALSLLNQQLTIHPSQSETAQSLLQRAECFAALDRREEAIASYRASLQAQDEFPNVRTGGELRFAWYIAVRQSAPHFEEALRLVERYESTTASRLLPVERFRCAVVRALIARERGETDESRRFAAIARQAASETHSGFRYHPSVGLVGPVELEVGERLAAIDAL